MWSTLPFLPVSLVNAWSEDRQHHDRGLGTVMIMSSYRILAISPDRLHAIRAGRRDDLGNPLEPMAADGWEPLRCCLRVADAGESIALISYSPFSKNSPWKEIGPVFIHPGECAGFDPAAGLPDHLRRGPRVLRTYRADESMNYDHIRLVPAGGDVTDVLPEVLDQPDVAFVHVRAAAAQCFGCEIRL